MKFFLPMLSRRSLSLVCPLAVFAVLAISNAALAQSKPKSRIDYFLEQADQLTITLTPNGKDGVKLQRQAQPVMTYASQGNPERAWGVMLLWLDDDMPVVASTYYMRWQRKQLMRELVSLADSPLVATRDGKEIWQPAGGCFARRSLPGATPPAEDAAQRLTQMKRAAERFHVDNLRLMFTPLYRYSSKKYGVIDGAMFALAGAHDPDALVLIEAVEQADGKKAWQYTIGRMSSDAMTVRLDDEEICALPPFWVKPETTLPYVEQFDSMLPAEITGAKP